MKRLLSVLLVVLLLSGCGAAQREAPVPTTDEVAEQYTSAAILYDWFDKISLACTGEPVEVDGMYYREVAADGPQTYADLEKAVHAYFAPALADRLLSESQNFRDIDGQLYCAEGGRGDNIYYYDKTVQAEQVDEDHFTVTLTFWANLAEDVMTVPPGTTKPHPTRQATVGYSQEVLHYERTEDGFRFTDFCSSDGLDLDADTVYTFNYVTDLETGAYADFSDWQLICYLTRADGAAAEAPIDDLLMRFLEHPQNVLRELTRLYESPLYGDPELAHLEYLVVSPAYGAASTLYADEQELFTSALDACQPETPAQQEVLELLWTTYEDRYSEDTGYDPDREFSLLVSGRDDTPMLTLGPQEGTFPWGYDLEGTPVYAGPADTFGTAYVVNCDGITVEYCEKDGVETLYRMETDIPYADPDRYCCTPRGLYCGYDEETLQRIYLRAVPLPGFKDPVYDSCYVYEVFTKHIAAYCKDGVILKIEVENLIDGQLLS